ncbi:MAG TPA: phage integrase SAM-like domain-containing protein [Chryseolinea sp.]|nr:phage integrase SAM-like domain-containing protein [Chryseolinea sp.]
MKPTVTLFLDTRTVLKTNKHRLKLRVGLSRNENRLYNLDFSFAKTEYQKLLKHQMKEPYKDTWNKIDVEVKRANAIIDGMMPYFSFSEFKDWFEDKKSFTVVSDKTSLMAMHNLLRAKYEKNGQLPMSVKIRDSAASILKFVNKGIKAEKKKDDIPMRSITPAFCRAYETYMVTKSKKQSRNGAGINMRHIRILFNEGISKRILPKEWYPFKRESGRISEFEDAYVIPNDQKVKVYLDEREMAVLSDAKTFDTERERDAHHAYFISFHCNGANAADFLRFKFRDIQGDFIIFYREKIKNATKTNRKPIKIYLSEELKKLISEVGNPPHPDSYIFKCFNDTMTMEEMYEARNRFNQAASTSLKVLLKKHGIEKNISIGKARHALANILKKNKVDREFAKDILGHTSIVTADNYYGQFEEDQHTSIFDNIVSMNKIKQRLANAATIQL